MLRRGWRGRVAVSSLAEFLMIISAGDLEHPLDLSCFILVYPKP
jgi:hypothetical protein